MDDLLPPVPVAPRVADVSVDTDSSLSSNDDVLSVAKVAMKVLHVPAGKVLWAHTKLKTLHLAFEGHTRVFLCCRKISSSFEEVEGKQRFDISRCRQCFNSKMAELDI